MRLQMRKCRSRLSLALRPFLTVRPFVSNYAAAESGPVSEKVEFELKGDIDNLEGEFRSKNMRRRFLTDIDNKYVVRESIAGVSALADACFIDFLGGLY